MLFLTEDSVLICAHVRGIVENITTQDWVTIAERRVLIEINPEGRPIKGCPNMGPGIRPCVTTLPVQKGYSDWIRIDEKRVCLDTVIGLTDGTPPGAVNYYVRDPEQLLVEELP
jgi:hypothetical protein